MKKQVLLLTVTIFAVALSGVALISLSNKERERAIPSVTTVDKNDILKFREAIERFKAGRTDGIDAAGLRIGAEELKELESLNKWIPYLNLSNSTVTGKDLAIVAKLTQLGAIHLSDTRITDKGIKHFENHPTLYHFWLDKMPITDKGLESLATVPGINAIHLWDNAITDEGCKSLAKMKNLKYVSLDGTMVTDAGMRHLFSLKNVNEIRTNGTRVTRQMRNEMRKHWPGIRLSPEFD